MLLQNISLCKVKQYISGKYGFKKDLGNMLFTGTLEEVLRSVLEYTERVIVVNDGSTDNTAAILARYPQVQQVAYTKNIGKGMALRKGFAAAIERGYDFAITIDTDGQHFATDLPAFLEKLQTERN